MFKDWRFHRSLRALLGTHRPIFRNYAQASWPTAATSVRKLELLALDFEMDGLKGGAHLLQAGWVPFTAASLPLADARSLDIRSERVLDETAVVLHGIGEERARKGMPVGDVLEILLSALAGKVVIAHGAAIERDCLRRSTLSVYGRPIPARTICTMAVECKLNPTLNGAAAYRLGATRARYNLPPHDLHSAIGDAIATAELFLAQLSRMPSETTLGELEALRVRH